MAKKALITGITGQDGSYLAELLLGKGYEVHGIIRRASTFNTGRLEGIYTDPHDSKARLRLHYGDLAEGSTVTRLIAQIQPDEVYNLAAQSHVRVSFDTAEYTTDIVATGTVRLLEAIRQTGLQPRFYQASSSEMFGKVREVPQRETTPFHPRSPYACAKVHAFYITVNYRESYGLHASNGILFNVGHGGKVQSSSWMIRDAARNFVRSIRPWGEFYGWDAGKEWKLKTIYISPKKRLSLQYHHHREEFWMLVDGDATATIHDKGGKSQVIPMKKGEVIHVDVKAVHRLESKKGGVVVEIALGDFDENDIVRLEDDHGRV